MMNNSENRIPEKITPEVLELASQYYANQTQSYLATELVQAGIEAQIPGKFIEQAIQEIQTRQKRRQKQQRQFQIIGAGILAVSTIWSIWTYNLLSNSASTVDAKWAQVENQLQRRADLIPNLVRVTQAYTEHEKGIVSLLTQSHEAYLQAKTPAEKAIVVVQVNESISRFQDYAANNPQLQSSQLFTNLQYEITGTENRITVERMRYNQAVQNYNQQIKQFPNSVMATLFGFKPREFYDAQAL